MEKYIIFSILRKIFARSDFRKSVFFNDFVSTKIQSTEPGDTYQGSYFHVSLLSVPKS